MFRARVPLAWKNLTHDPRRLAVALAGIGFAVLLMFMETGFENALFDSMVKMPQELDADIVITSTAQTSLTSKQTFSREQVLQAASCEGVAEALPLYIESFFAIWKKPGGLGHPIRVLAYDPRRPMFLAPELARYHDALMQPHTALYDRRGKREKYGVPETDQALSEQRGALLAGKSIRLVGSFQLGRDFVNDGNLVMSADNLARYFPQRAGDPLSVVDLGVVRVAPDYDVADVKQRLVRILPAAVRVDTKAEFVARERAFWRNSTPIGYIFWVGKIMGFVVGVIICYQIIFADIADHMPEFATLKAMGYRSGYFIKIVLQQSIYLSALGFIPGCLAAYVIYDRLASGTGLLMFLTPGRVGLVLLSTVVMCVASGSLAIRKVLAAEPAELF